MSSLRSSIVKLGEKLASKKYGEVGSLAARLERSHSAASIFRRTGDTRAAAFIEISAANQALAEGNWKSHRRRFLSAVSDLRRTGRTDMARRLKRELVDLYGEPGIPALPLDPQLWLKPQALREIIDHFGQDQNLWEGLLTCGGIKPATTTWIADEAARLLERWGLGVYRIPGGASEPVTIFVEGERVALPAPRDGVVSFTPPPGKKVSFEVNENVVLYHPRAVDRVLSHYGQRFGLEQLGRTADEAIASVFCDWLTPTTEGGAPKPIALFLGYDPMTTGLNNLVADAPFRTTVDVVGGWEALIFLARNLENGRTIGRQAGRFLRHALKVTGRRQKVVVTVPSLLADNDPSPVFHARWLSWFHSQLPNIFA